MAEGKYRRLSCGGCGDGSRLFSSLLKSCAQCGMSMAQSDKRSFCSRKCVGLSQRTTNPVVCAECNVTFWRRKGGVDHKEGREPKYCSKKCYGAWVSRTRLSQFAPQREVKEKAKAQRELMRETRRAQIKANPILYTCTKCSAILAGGWSIYCRACAAVLTKERKRKYAANSRKTPSGRALHHKEKALRRAKQRSIEADSIDPIKVFERDKWRCQLCGVRTPAHLRGSYEMKAPELDHVVTLGDNGTHTWGNVQCACRGCNLRKGAKSLGQIGFGFS